MMLIIIHCQQDIIKVNCQQDIAFSLFKSVILSMSMYHICMDGWLDCQYTVSYL